MSDRPYWWDWVADRLPYMGILFRLWVVVAILFIDDGKDMSHAYHYWTTAGIGDKHATQPDT